MIEANDDKRHQPDTDDQLWGESWYFNFYDPKNRVGMFTRMGLYPNKDVANMAVLVVADGREVYNRAWHNLPLPEGDIDTGISLGGVTYRANEMLKSYSLTFADELTPLNFNLCWEALMPPHNSMEGLQLNAATSFHLEQAGKISGTIKLRDTEWQIDGVGNRDHSIGIRNWAAFTHHELAWPVFEDGTALGILRIYFEGGGSADLCWAYVDGAIDTLSLEEFTTTLNDEGRALSAKVAAVDGKGRRFEIDCIRQAVVHWPFDAYVLNEGAFEFRLADGRVGYGLLELGCRLGAN